MQEMVIIGLIVLVVFGPKNLPGMARDVGRFVSGARRSVEEFKEDLVSEKEGSREPHEGQHEVEVGGGLEEGIAREEEAVSPPNASRTD